VIRDNTIESGHAEQFSYGVRVLYCNGARTGLRIERNTVSSGSGDSNNIGISLQDGLLGDASDDSANCPSQPPQSQVIVGRKPPVVIDRNDIRCGGDADQDCAGIVWNLKTMPVGTIGFPPRTATRRRVIANNLIVTSGMDNCTGVDYIGGTLDLLHNTIDVRGCTDTSSNNAIHSRNTTGSSGSMRVIFPKTFSNILLSNVCALSHTRLSSGSMRLSRYSNPTEVKANTVFPATTSWNRSCLHVGGYAPDPNDAMTLNYNGPTPTLYLNSDYSPIPTSIWAVGRGLEEAGDYTDVLTDENGNESDQDAIFDKNNVERPVGGTYDRGAFEYTP